MLIRRAKRVSDFLNADCLAVSVGQSRDTSGLPETDRDALERHLNFARNLHIETRILEGADVASTVVDFARRNQVTQIFLIRAVERKRWCLLPSKDVVQKIVDMARDMQIVIVSQPDPAY